MSANASADPDNDALLLEQWHAAWPQALAVWSKYTRIRDARLCTSTVEAAKEGLRGSFAMIRLMDQSVVIDLESVRSLDLVDYGIEILAHEIGHHVLAPGSATDQFRLLARVRRALPTLEGSAPMVANLYTDLYINDRLQRQSGLRIADIYRALAKKSAAAMSPETAPHPSAVWTLYMRIYEQLWQLDRASLSGDSDLAGLDADAWLGAKLIRVYASDWMTGAGRFATLLLPYLVADDDDNPRLAYLHDTQDAAAGCDPGGAHEVEADEMNGSIHPADDPLISGVEYGTPAAVSCQESARQAREPSEYGEILRAAGIKLSGHEIAMRYYRERALPHLVSFPSREAPEAAEPQLEAVEPWNVGDPLDEIDWLQTVMLSPRPIPGVTTVRHTFGATPSQARDHVPVDLDLYVDSSGSMPNPQTHTSFLALAGAIVALSALRSGSAVQVTLWSDYREELVTKGFVRDEDDVLRVLTGFFGGGTRFPIHRLRKTYSGRVPRARPTHILMISDDGITTMFDKDEKGNDGWTVAAAALEAGAAGGTMALNLPDDWASNKLMSQVHDDLKRARAEQGWDIHAISRFEDLIAFARAFSRRHYDGTHVRQIGLPGSRRTSPAKV